MQIKQFKKRTLNETLIIVVLLISFAGAVYFVDTISEEHNQSNAEAKAQLQTMENEFSTVQKKYTFITQNIDLYNEVEKKQSEGKLLIGRQVMFEKFNQFRNQFGLRNLHLSVSPVQEDSNPKFKRKFSVVNYSEVNVDLDVLNDENIYALLDAMQHELSGICVFSNLNMKLTKPLDDEILKTISTTGTYPLIKSTIKFNWYSINPLEPSTTSDNANKP